MNLQHPHVNLPPVILVGAGVVGRAILKSHVDAGVSLQMIDCFAQTIPVLGVCLGHQSIVEHFGGKVIGAGSLTHGKSSAVSHDGQGVYRGLPNPFEAGRYHSLAADKTRIPQILEITARTEDGEIMGVRHKQLAVEGVQFHPESVLTPDGPKLMENFLYPQRMQ